MRIILDPGDQKRMERLGYTMSTNRAMAEALQSYLAINPGYVAKNHLQEFVDEYEMSPELAYAMILATALGFDIHKNSAHKELFQDYIEPAIRLLKAEDFSDDPFLRSIKTSGQKHGSLEFAPLEIKACEAFWAGDCHTTSEFREFPSIGFFMEDFKCPAIKENGKIIAAASPLAIATAQGAIEQARGNVLCLGLGAGYFAAMSAAKKSVAKITVLEPRADVAELFKSEILPQIPNAGKIELINASLPEIGESQKKNPGFDFLFSDTQDLKTYLKLRSGKAYFSREGLLLSQMRQTVFLKLKEIYENPTEGGKTISTYREVASMLGDSALREIRN